MIGTGKSSFSIDLAPEVHAQNRKTPPFDESAERRRNCYSISSTRRGRHFNVE